VKAVRPFNAANLNRPDTKAATLLSAPPAATATPGPEFASGALEAIGRSASLPPPPGGSPTPGPAPQKSDLRPPSVITRVAPELSTSVRQFGLQGIVELEAAIDKQGFVKDVRVVSGDPRLAAAAKQAVLKWRYRPATLNGQPVEMGLTVRVNFDGKR
jgi:TonB family protein